MTTKGFLPICYPAFIVLSCSSLSTTTSHGECDETVPRCLMEILRGVQACAEGADHGAGMCDLMTAHMSVARIGFRNG